MGVAKVTLNGVTQMDVTQKTVEANKMLSGITALRNDGESITGSIASKSSSDLTASGATVTAPAGYYASSASKSVTTATLPTATTTTKPSGTTLLTIDRNTSTRYLSIPAGYETGGYYTISPVANGSVTAPSTISGSSATVSTGTNTLTLTKTVSVTPSVTTAGYISAGTAGNSSVSLTASVTTQGATTYNTSSSDQTIASGTYLTGTQTIRKVTTSGIDAANIKDGTVVQVGDAGSAGRIANVTGTFTDASTVSSGQTAATASRILSGYSAWVDGVEVKGSIATITMPTSASSSATSGYTSKATISRSTNDQYINIPAGYNASNVYYKVNAVANGSAAAPATISGSSANLSVGSNTISLSKTVSVTPVVSAGYVSSGTATNSNVSLTANVTTKAATTYYPSGSDQTVAAATYVTGAQTFKAVKLTNLSAANIAEGVVVKVGDADDDDRIVSITGTHGGAVPPTLLTKTVTANGTYNASDDSADGYSSVVVNVPTGTFSDTVTTLETGGDYHAITGIQVGGTKTITTSGVHDVANYAFADVNIGGSSWTRPSDWPDLSQMDVSGGDILYMTSYADEARGFCSFYVQCTGSYTVEVGTISGSTFTADSTQTYSSNNYCELYYGSTNGTYKVLRVTGTAIKKLVFKSTTTCTIGTFNGYSSNQGIIDVVGKLPSGTDLSCSNQYNIVNMEISGLTLTESITNMFYSCYSLTSLDVSDWNTSAVTNMASMFYGCSSLVSLDVSGWNTSAVQNMSSMFHNCKSLTSLDVSGWDTGKVTTMGSMFNGCYSLTSLDVSDWNTTAVIDMGSMFSGCYSLISLDVSGWDTGAVTTMGNMFYTCCSLTSLDVSDWNTSAVTSMASMFSGCYSLKSLDVSDWDTSAVTSMSSMFYNCNALASLDVNDWDTSAVTTMSSMFNYCYSLTSINVSSWDFSLVTTAANTNNMFRSARGLHGSITLPASMSAIGTYCFYELQSIYEWHFLATTPPTLANTNAFGQMTYFGGKKIYVPAASLNAYKTAENWSTYADYMVGE